MTVIKPVLEPAAQEFADSTANPPQLYDLPVDQGRKIVDSVQDGDIPVPPMDTTDLMIEGGPSGKVSIKVFRPRGASGDLPVVLFTHGAGWVFGDAHTHGRLGGRAPVGIHQRAPLSPPVPRDLWHVPPASGSRHGWGKRLTSRRHLADARSSESK